MLGGLPLFKANAAPLRSRKSMLDTLVRNLHMVRLTVAALALLVVGCTGLIGDEGSGGTPEEIAARNAWLGKALPRLSETCSQCHDGSRLNIGFIQGDSDLGKRDTLIAYTPAVANFDAPPSSRILTKGVHEGPELGAEATSDILDWLQKEKLAQDHAGPGGGPPVIATGLFLPQICTSGLPGDVSGCGTGGACCPFNNVTLDDVGATGAKITFIAQALGSGLYLTRLTLEPATAGAFIEHPLFVSMPAVGDPIPDTIDRFFAVKMNLQMTATATDKQIGGGTAAFVGFAAGPMDKLQIHFKGVGVFKPDQMPPQMNTGCRDLTSFNQNAQAQLNANCASCHAGANANATSAMNLTGINDPANDMLACNQVRTRVDLNAAANSGVFLAPKPGNMNHPFTFGGNQTTYNAFVAAVTAWINIERTKP